MPSLRGIYYDLNESVYNFQYDNLLFTFSSKFYLDKFKSEYNDYLKNETLKLKSKYNCILYCDEMLLLDLYKKIEKRGFKVLYDGVAIKENYFIDAIINKDNSF